MIEVYEYLRICITECSALSCKEGREAIPIGINIMIKK
jgi:hypothetical protein